MTASSIRKRSFVKDSKSSRKGVLLGYARVSKGDEQSNAVQAEALRAAGCRRIFEEAASGGRWDRPELHRMLDQLRPGDVVAGRHALKSRAISGANPIPKLRV